MHLLFKLADIRYILLVMMLLTYRYPLSSQQLNHRQGQLLIQFKENYGWDSGQKKPVISRSRGLYHKISPIRKLAGPWNIWLVSFDFTKLKENELIRDFQTLPEVIHIQKNHIIVPRIMPDDPFFPSQWHHLNDQDTKIDFDSDLAWDLTTGGISENGDTIVLCVIDDGIDINHSDLKENLWVNRHEIPNNSLDDDGNGYIDDVNGWNTYKLNDQFDLGKHGTQISGLAAARGNNGTGISGICWKVKLLFVQGGGDEANAIESYSYPLLQRRLYQNTGGQKGAFVVATNSSWGTDFGKPEDAPIWCAIYDSLGKEGIVSIASTANKNIDVDIEGDLPTSCESEFLITVTNMNRQNNKVASAAFGSKSIDLGAYGEAVYSTYINNSYRLISGTSASSPQVTGAVALLYSLPCSNLSFLARQNPPEAAREIKRILLQSVQKNTDLTLTTVSGGILNLYQSLLGVSPLYPSNITDHSISLNWKVNGIYPVKIRYRIKDESLWSDTSIYTGSHFILQNLEACTEYEIQYKNICNRNTNDFSVSRFYKTSGCCDAPDGFKLMTNSGTEVQIGLSDLHNMPLVILLRKTNTPAWDTFEFKLNMSNFILRQLDPCCQYEFMAYTFCNSKSTPLSKIFQFSTDGCLSCSELNYCRRFRPSADLEWLEAIALNNLYFKTGNNLGYGDFTDTNQKWILEKNKLHTFKVDAGYANDTSQLVLAVWIDYNQDGNFDTNENIALPTVKFRYSKSHNFMIPGNALIGWTRMRIMLKFAEFSESTPLPCFQSIEFGEYEDYCVFITSSLCQNIESIRAINLGPHQAEFMINHQSATDFTYSYRKLYSQNWIAAVTNSNRINLINLDSCSRYELKCQAKCSDYFSESLTYKFDTPGNSCMTGVKDYKENSITIAPNPFTDYLRITNPFGFELHRITIYSSQGTLISMIPVHSSEYNQLIPLNLKAGLYFVQVEMGEGKRKIFTMVRI